MAHALDPLKSPPAALGPAAALLARFDDCLALGFGRLGSEQHGALGAVGRATSATPLGPPLQEALQAIRRSEFLERHFVTLALSRAAIQGALYDALRAQVAQALSRPTDDPAPAPGPAVTAPTSLLESARHWLMEIAIAGFRQLEPETLLPFAPTLEKLQAEPALFRLATLLTGFLNELLAALPMAALETLPSYRWADLWTRAMLLSVRPPAPPAGQPVSGELRLLGADLHHHPSTVSVVAYGLLDAGRGARLVRVTRSAYKVDVVLGREQLRLLNAPNLMRALAEPVALKVDGMQLLGSAQHSGAPSIDSGDLLWDDNRAKPGAGFDLIAASRVFAPGGKAPPGLGLGGADRHPAQLAELVFLEGAPPLPVDTLRLSQAAELPLDKIAKAQRMLALIRFDGGRYTLQPLWVHAQTALAVALAPPAAVAKFLAKGDPVSTLRERASKLLRQKA